MSEPRSIRIPTEWAFRITQLVLTLIIGYVVLWVRADIRDELKKELAHYLPREQFEAYRGMHGDWGNEVVKRLQESVANIDSRLQRVETKIDRLSERRAEVNPKGGVNGKPMPP